MHTILLAVNWAELFLMYLSKAGQSQSIQHILPKVYLGKNECQFPLVLGPIFLRESIAQSSWARFFLEHLASWVPCSQSCCFTFPLQQLKKISSFISWGPKRKWWAWLPAFWPPLLCQVSVLVWLQWKIPLQPSTDECRLFNCIESTEINFYKPNRVSSWVPVIVSYLGPVFLGTGAS